MTVLRLKTASGIPDSFIAIVKFPSDPIEVRVRMRARGHGRRWACDVHGSHDAALCPHQGAALAAWRRHQTKPTESENTP